MSTTEITNAARKVAEEFRLYRIELTGWGWSEDSTPAIKLRSLIESAIYKATSTQAAKIAELEKVMIKARDWCISDRDSAGEGVVVTAELERRVDFIESALNIPPLSPSAVPGVREKCPKCGSYEVSKGYAPPESYVGETDFKRCDECDHQWDHQ